LFSINSPPPPPQGKEKMSLETFNRFIDGFGFNEKLKSITFAGLGEPLLNKNLPQMIKLSKKIALESILVTNGALLTKGMSDALIHAGLDTIRISLQGLDGLEYEKVCGVHIDFDKFLNNINYYYQNKKNTKIWIKAPNIVINTEDKIRKFKNIFSDKCDVMTSMNIVPLYDVDYSKFDIDENRSCFEQNAGNVTVCPQPFYSLYLLPNGDVYPCCAIEKQNLAVGNINDSTLYEIWNGAILKNFQYLHLKETWKMLAVCHKCTQPNNFNNEYDNIDEIQKELVIHFS
jgi:radical SAM protein with 4Fe4S-binding SPASM domain